MEERFSRNIPAITEKEQAMLARSHVLIVGCGGLGGYLAEYMVRLGVGEITAADGDCFAVSNANRQLLCTADTVGKDKALSALRRAQQIAPDVRFHAVSAPMDAQNADALVRGKSLVLDALDNAESRLLLEQACAAAGVPIVHGAISGWQLQAAAVLPGSGVLSRLYGGKAHSAEAEPSLSFVPAYCAAVQAAEAARLLCGREPLLAGKLLIADLETLEQYILPL